MTNVNVNHLTKIEGHASLRLRIERGIVKECALRSVEGSRYFEGIVRGRLYHEAPELTSRICGVCSCAHTLASIFAMEHALGLKVSSQTIALRTLLNYAERIRSHATHLYFLSLPDFLGFESALAMIPTKKKELARALSLMKLGNTMVTVVGGRDLHPVSAQIGGFLNLPKKEKLRDIQRMLRENLPFARETVDLFDSLTYPTFERTAPSFSVFNEKEFGMFTGPIKADKLYPQDEYTTYLKEFHEKDSTANFVVKEGRSYRVGALPRMNNSAHLLRPEARKRAQSLHLPSNNPFINNRAQAIELLHAIEECIAVLDSLTLREEKQKIPPLKNGHGIAAIEVPRGTLWHEYIIRNGKIRYCNIITPTAQNLRAMEEDIRAFLPSVLHKKRDDIVTDVEKLIRAYDPCFSCSTHFLDVEWVSTE